MTTGVPGSEARDSRSKWSRWPCEIRMMSAAASTAGSGRGPWRWSGPSFGRRNGSVRIRTPSISMRTVAWPRNRIVTIG
jgi:hypothetical protein